MTELEKYGLEIADKLGFDGLEILEVLQYALTESNYHEEASKVQNILAESMQEMGIGS